MSRSVILCYHKVGPEAEEGRRLNVEPSRLRSHAAFFARRGVPFVLPRDLAGSWPVSSVCFTFDDAYTSAVLYAPAVLEEFGARGAFYAVTSLVGQSSTWDGNLARPLANWDHLRELDAKGHEIGNHTAHHPHLDVLSPSEQSEEVESAAQAFSTQGLSVLSFCYPYGGIGGVGAIAAAGYKVALGLDKRIATDAHDRLRLPRIVVAFSDTIPMLLYRVYVRPRLRRNKF
jgi:peptidoglycan/xylan/chitin deacetylase (PgdA/CDA1 family)